MLLLCLFATAACVPSADLSPPSRAAIAADAGNVVDDRQIVAVVGSEAAADRLQRRAQDRGYSVEARDTLAALGLVQLVFRVPAHRSPAGAIAELEALERGATAGVNHAYRLQAAPRVYANAVMDWPETGCRSLVPVGIIDGDIDPSVPDLSGAQVVRRDFTGGAAAGSAHGAAIASLLGGRGRLGGVRLDAAVVVSTRDDLAAGVDALTRAIDWLGSRDVRLVNVSLAGPYNKILDRGIQAASARGMVFVAAAGNAGPLAPPRYPAAFDQVIAVTAIDADLDRYDAGPVGRHIDFSAPGVDVYVPSAGTYLSGTSVAAPFVTALVASDPALAGQSAGAVRDALAGHSVDLGAAGRDDVFGYGLPRLSQACRR
jgi:hypothetical protein